MTAVNTNLSSKASNLISYWLYDQSNGTLVASGKINVSGATMDFSNLPPGVYILQIETEDGVEIHRILLK
ncbi:MAG: T9SS type A sorting domain-containing protein [Tannerellaceae bacterium]|nr:T9SS type A sorting domain-containing protein [Tannerellaceae bacterium]